MCLFLFCVLFCIGFFLCSLRITCWVFRGEMNRVFFSGNFNLLTQICSQILCKTTSKSEFSSRDIMAPFNADGIVRGCDRRENMYRSMSVEMETDRQTAPASARVPSWSGANLLRSQSHVNALARLQVLTLWYFTGVRNVVCMLLLDFPVLISSGRVLSLCDHTAF